MGAELQQNRSTGSPQFDHKLTVKTLLAIIVSDRSSSTHTVQPKCAGHAHLNCVYVHLSRHISTRRCCGTSGGRSNRPRRVPLTRPAFWAHSWLHQRLHNSAVSLCRGAFTQYTHCPLHRRQQAPPSPAAGPMAGPAAPWAPLTGPPAPAAPAGPHLGGR